MQLQLLARIFSFSILSPRTLKRGKLQALSTLSELAAKVGAEAFRSLEIPLQVYMCVHNCCKITSRHTYMTGADCPVAARTLSETEIWVFRRTRLRRRFRRTARTERSSWCVYSVTWSRSRGP